VRNHLGSVLVASAVTLVATAATAADPASGEGSDDLTDAWSVRGLRSLELSTLLGYHRRLNDPPSFEADERDAIGGGLAAAAFLSRRFAITLGWERFGLGEERSGITSFGTAAVRRRADGAWFGLRMAPWSNAWLTTSVGLGVGIAWQHVDASGAVWPAFEPGRPTAVTCDGTGSPAPALRLDLGVSAPLGSGLSVFANGGFGVFAFSDGDVGGCISGAGSSEVLALRTGFAYAFDVGGRGD